MYEYEVQFFPINQVMSDELTDSFYKTCARCAKDVLITPDIAKRMPKSMIDGSFSCKFCYNNGFDKRPILIFSFRSIICHLYESHEIGQSTHVKYTCQLFDFIKAHKITGLKNFCFAYDDESFNWFVDMSLVGDGDGRVHVREVLRTVVEILACFNPSKNSIDCREVFKEIKLAIESAVGGNLETRVIVPIISQHRQSPNRLMSFNLGRIK